MFNSLYKDLRYEILKGGVVTKLIFVNIVIFFTWVLVKIFVFGISENGREMMEHTVDFLTLPSTFSYYFKQPWSIVTYAFLHFDLFHFLINMIAFYWFGSITADLIGQKRVLPMYFFAIITGGLVSLLFNFLTDLHKNEPNFYMVGSSGAVLAFLFTAATLAPNFNLRIILIGNVKLKYIAFTLLFIEVVLLLINRKMSNAYIHLGGALAGFIYVYLLRNGTDLFSIFKVSNFNSNTKNSNKKPKSRIVNIFEKLKKEQHNPPDTPIFDEQKLDIILIKIKTHGKNSLTPEEIDFLNLYANR